MPLVRRDMLLPKDGAEAVGLVWDFPWRNRTLGIVFVCKIYNLGVSKVLKPL